MITKKGDGSQVKESTDSSSTTIEDDDIKGKYYMSSPMIHIKLVKDVSLCRVVYPSLVCQGSIKTLEIYILIKNTQYYLKNVFIFDNQVRKMYLFKFLFGSHS